MDSITVLGASRNRPEKMAEVIENWTNKSCKKYKIDFVVSIDDDDEKSESYKQILEEKSKKLDIEIRLLINSNKNTVEAINRCKDYIKGDLIVVFSDDTECPDNWDEELITCDKKGMEDFIIKVGDGINEDLITMPIFSRKYLEKKDYIYNPIYSHMFCDTEITCVAHMEGVVIKLDDLIFNHIHYSQDKREKDYVDEKNQNTFYRGFQIFKERYRNYFGLDKEKMKGIPVAVKEWVKKNKNGF